jgi:predicted phage terminase large subunit-like protein
MPDGSGRVAPFVIKPHDGPQTAFLSTPADIAIYGGAAGGGKSWGLLMEPLRHVTTNPLFMAMCFRRTTPQITNPGGLWDQSLRLYPALGATPVSTYHEFRWGNAGKVRFGHLEHAHSVLDYQGSELPLIMYDELTHFLASQFWYLLSRNRSISGIRAYIRATTNPDAESWVAELIAWWIDQTTGLAIPERSGVIRWFVRIEETLYWADKPEELTEQFPGSEPKSLTFIASSLDDNPTLTRNDPGYRANLMAMQRVERERLLFGNWLIRPSAGQYFQRGWVQTVDAIPAGTVWVRGYDLASTEYDGTNNPDWTVSVLIGRCPDGSFIVADMIELRGSPAKVETLIVNTASFDARKVTIAFPQDAGQAGKWQVADFVKKLAGYKVKTSPESGDKTTRFSPFSAQCEAGNVKVLRGEWNGSWYRQLELFPPTGTGHDDHADATSRAFNELTSTRGRMNVTDKLLDQFRTRR